MTRSGRKPTSCDRYPHAPLALGRKGEAGLDIFRRRVREVVENLSNGHAGCEVGEDLVTVMRMPRMHGRPPRLPGSRVIRDRHCSYTKDLLPVGEMSHRPICELTTSAMIPAMIKPTIVILLPKPWQSLQIARGQTLEPRSLSSVGAT